MHHRGRTVSIQPGVRVLNVFAHLNYKAWYAMAEFVDNALQSFLDNRGPLAQCGLPTNSVRVDITIESGAQGRITIRDNAAGIAEADYARAFKPAAPPPDAHGLSEFGMGMKSAACWFARKWSVRTKALGERFEALVEVDLDAVGDSDIGILPVSYSDSHPSNHYTEVSLISLNKGVHGRTIGKIREHLASIYREFIREGVLELYVNDPHTPVCYEEPTILRAPYYTEPNGEPLTWRREIDLDLGQGLSARGFMGLLERGSVSNAGLALFRRGRLIQGSCDESYRPFSLFRHSNSYAYQRVFGELHLEGFAVTHTKDGFQWGEQEEPFLELLKEEIDTDPLPLLRQAEGHRVRPPRKELVDIVRSPTEETTQAVRDHVPPVLEGQFAAPSADGDVPSDLPECEKLEDRTLELDFDGRTWRVTIQVSSDPSVRDWLTLSESTGLPSASASYHVKLLTVRIGLDHPFMQQFGLKDSAQFEPLLRVAVGLALAETSARENELLEPSMVRINLNDLLRNALSRP